MRDRRGVSAEFKFRTWSVGFRAEVGGWGNQQEVCVMCCVDEREHVEHVLFRCRAYEEEDFGGVGRN